MGADTGVRTGAAIGCTLSAAALSNVDFDASLNALNLHSYNAGAYAAFQSGGFYANAIGKVDWITAETQPAASIATSFNATAWGLRGNIGYRASFGSWFFEPGASLCT